MTFLARALAVLPTILSLVSLCLVVTVACSEAILVEYQFMVYKRSKGELFCRHINNGSHGFWANYLALLKNTH
jgi:hypothetical protein